MTANFGRMKVTQVDMLAFKEYYPSPETLPLKLPSVVALQEYGLHSMYNVMVLVSKTFRLCLVGTI